jgi:hypothetical protein
MAAMSCTLSLQGSGQRASELEWAISGTGGTFHYSGPFCLAFGEAKLWRMKGSYIKRSGGAVVTSSYPLGYQVKNGLYQRPHLDLNSSVSTNVGAHTFVEDPFVSIDLFCISFLTVGAGFGLTKAGYFPPEAARGAAHMVLVRRLANGLASLWRMSMR